MQYVRSITFLALVLSLLLCGNAFSKGPKHKGFTFSGLATGAQEVPGNNSPGTGEVLVLFDGGLTEAQFLLEVKDLGSSVVGAHFHCAPPGTNGPVVFGLMNPGPLTEIIDKASGTLTNANWSGADCSGLVGHPVSNIASLYFAMKAGFIYLNFHTAGFPGGEVRAQIQFEK
jgi:hypothetical protein